MSHLEKYSRITHATCHFLIKKYFFKKKLKSKLKKKNLISFFKKKKGKWGGWRHLWWWLAATPRALGLAYEPPRNPFGVARKPPIGLEGSILNLLNGNLCKVFTKVFTF
jgi:hypothetical protein